MLIVNIRGILQKLFNEINFMAYNGFKEFFLNSFKSSENIKPFSYLPL